MLTANIITATRIIFALLLSDFYFLETKAYILHPLFGWWGLNHFSLYSLKWSCTLCYVFILCTVSLRYHLVLLHRFHIMHFGKIYQLLLQHDGSIWLYNCEKFKKPHYTSSSQCLKIWIYMQNANLTVSWAVYDWQVKAVREAAVRRHAGGLGWR